MASSCIGFRSRLRAAGFTLIELLVVVAIIAMLLAILVPSLAVARESAKLSVCGSNERQIGLALRLYADVNDGYLPRGPDAVADWDFIGTAQHATNQLYSVTGYGIPERAPFFTGMGVLVRTTRVDPHVLFCPDGDGLDVAEEIRQLERIAEGKLSATADSVCNYLYRHLDFLPAGHEDGRIDSLGINRIEDQYVAAEALALDLNVWGDDPLYNLNHSADRVNVLYRDGAVIGFENLEQTLSFVRDSLSSPAAIVHAMDQLLCNADYGYRGDHPRNAPRIEQSP